MQLVAASKMKTFQKKSVSTLDYTRDLLKTLRLTAASLDDTSYAEKREDGKTLFVLLTSDKGLCGAMNTRLIRELFESDEWKNTSEDNRQLITIGRKSTETAKNLGIETLNNFTGLTEDMTPIDALEIIDAILGAWDDGDIKEVKIISPWYVNAFTFETHINTFLPLSQDMVNEHLEKYGEENQPETSTLIEAAFLEPSRDEIVHELAEQVVQTLFIEAFYELKATEYSSRMVAMKKATEAADDKIKSLTQVFNKARQSAITAQLSELAAANEAMSGADVQEYFA